MRVINYIKEIADDRKAAFAGLEQTDTPEVLLEKVRVASLAWIMQGRASMSMMPVCHAEAGMCLWSSFLSFRCLFLR